MTAASPSLVSYIALLSWPFVAIVLYRSRPMAEATIWTIIGGFLLLPVGVGIKIPVIPEFDKNTIPNICASIGCVLVSRHAGQTGRRFGWIEVLVGIYIISPIITSWLNADPIVIGAMVLPGVGAYDGTSAAIGQFMFFLSFLIGRRFLRNARDSKEIMRVLVVAGLAYSLLMLFEMRFSPQLHNWIYGFQPSQFVQSMRDGGFRPIVFTGHGLIAAFFLVTTVIAAATLWRIKVRAVNLPPTGVTAYLAVILVLCKSGAALVYGIVLVPLVRFASAKLQARVAMILVAVALAFPLLRAADRFPTAVLLDTAGLFSAERASSLEFRFDQEQKLLERANERFWFGWGRYGRSRIYDEDGGDRSITDGFWIITLGQFGFIGFMATFLLLTVPVFYAALALKCTNSLQESLSLAALALMVAVGVIDLLPNASVRPWTLLIAGALLGRAEVLLAARGGLKNQSNARIGQ